MHIFFTGTNSLKEPNSKKLVIVKYDKLFHIGFAQNEINDILY